MASFARQSTAEVIAANDINELQVSLEQRAVSVKDPLFGAVGDGVADDKAAIQAAIDACAAAGGGTVYFPKGTYLVNTPLTWASGVHLIGSGVRPGVSADSCWIKGIAGQDTILLSVAASQNGMSFRNVRITGGDTCLKSSYLAYDVTLENLELAGNVSSIDIAAGSIERWSVRDVLLSGGTYGFRMQYVLAAGLNYLDKCVFEQVRTNGQSKNGWRIEGHLSNSCTWINPIVNSPAEHGFYADIGGVGWTIIQYNSELVGLSGKNARTTGSITAATASLVVANATGFAEGDPIVVAGAGANGADLVTTITTIAGTTFTLAANASTTVTSLNVTNASWDDLHFTNTLAGTGSTDVSFIGGIIGVEGASGKQRYGVNAQTGRFTFIDARINARPVYDPSFRTTIIGGDVSVRQPSAVTALNPLYPTLPLGGTREANRGIISSPGGKPLTIFLNDSALNGTGTRDKLEVRLFDSNRTRVLYVDSATTDVVQERSTGHLTANGILRINPKANPATCSVGDLNIHTDNALYICSATNTWTAV